MTDATRFDASASEEPSPSYAFEDLARHSTDLTLVIDEVGRLRYASPAARRMLGPQVGPAPKLSALVVWDDYGAVETAIKHALANPGVRIALSCRMVSGTGSNRRLTGTITNRIPEESIAGLVVNLREITEGNELEPMFKALVESMPAVVYFAESGADGRWHYVSPQIERMLGFTPEEWTDDPYLWYRQLHPDDRDRAVAEDSYLWESGDGRLVSEYRILTRDGSVKWIRDEGAVVHDKDGRPLYWGAVLLDITDRKNLERQLEHIALHDGLTRIPNRRLLEDRVAHALAAAKRSRARVALLYIDLDSFKQLNDELGHWAGDEILVLVAERITAALRAGDTVARIGGDEFAVLMEGVDGEDDAVRLAERIRDQLAEPVSVGPEVISISASVGITVGGDEDTFESLLRAADASMYSAKARGAGGGTSQT